MTKKRKFKFFMIKYLIFIFIFFFNTLHAKENELNETLSQHENIDGIWSFSSNSKVRSSIIHDTVHNLKRYWCPKNYNIDWSNNSQEFLNEFL